MVQVLIGAGVLAVGVAFYLLSVQSRRTYRCNQCGESVRVEHMGAFRCGMCGAPLKEEVK